MRPAHYASPQGQPRRRHQRLATVVMLLCRDRRGPAARSKRLPNWWRLLRWPMLWLAVRSRWAGGGEKSLGDGGEVRRRGGGGPAGQDPPVDGQVLAGDERGCVAGQPQRGRRDVGWRPGPADRLVGLQPGPEDWLQACGVLVGPRWVEARALAEDAG